MQKLNIFMDTNIIKCIEPNLLQFSFNETYKKLKEFIDENEYKKIHIVIPKIVIEELIKQYIEEYRYKYENLDSKVDVLLNDCSKIGWDIKINKKNNMSVSKYEKYIRKKANEYIKKEKINIIELNKENFYKTYSDSILDFPKTLYYDCSLKKKLNVDFKFPIIIKPSNVVEYNHLKFEGKNKIYKVENKKDLKDIVNRIVESGYKDTLIIQEFIPGDDSYLFDSVVYVDHNHKVKLISMAQIGLQEHTKSMVGNAAVLINGYNQHGDIHAMEDVIKKFMEDIGYQGFAEFDLKYDSRDKKYKVLEINA